MNSLMSSVESSVNAWLSLNRAVSAAFFNSGNVTFSWTWPDFSFSAQFRDWMFSHWPLWTCLHRFWGWCHCRRQNCCWFVHMVLKCPGRTASPLQWLSHNAFNMFYPWSIYRHAYYRYRKSLLIKWRSTTHKRLRLLFSAEKYFREYLLLARYCLSYYSYCCPSDGHPIHDLYGHATATSSIPSRLYGFSVFFLFDFTSCVARPLGISLACGVLGGILYSTLSCQVMW